MKNSVMLLVGLLVAVMVAQARADDKSIDDQYQALAASRTKADLALRRARDFYDQNENNWRQISMAIDTAHARIQDEFRKNIEAEQKKPEESRDNEKIASMNERSKQIEQDWFRFANVEHMGIENRYRQGQQQVQNLTGIFGQYANLESSWKDARLDVASMQSGFDTMAKRADDVLEQAKKTTDELTQVQKTWEGLTTVGPAGK